MEHVMPEVYLTKKLNEAKTHFERTLDCKHTEFDDLYPYMMLEISPAHSGLAKWAA